MPTAVGVLSAEYCLFASNNPNNPNNPTKPTGTATRSKHHRHQELSRTTASHSVTASNIDLTSRWLRLDAETVRMVEREPR